MAVERVWLFQRVVLHLDTAGQYTFEFETDLPGGAMAIRHTATIAATAATATVRLPGSTRGRLYRARLYGAGEARLYRGKVFAKPMGPPGPTSWAWYALPIETTPEAYGAAALPIRPTPEGWSEQPLPLAGTSLVPRWIDLPMDE